MKSNYIWNLYLILSNYLNMMEKRWWCRTVISFTFPLIPFLFILYGIWSLHGIIILQKQLLLTTVSIPLWLSCLRYTLNKKQQQWRSVMLYLIKLIFALLHVSCLQIASDAWSWFLVFHRTIFFNFFPFSILKRLLRCLNPYHDNTLFV